MNVSEFATILNARLVTGETGLERQVSGMYACDLLSWVMSHASQGDGWITIHTNLNVVAVALLTEAACIIIPENIEVEQATIDKAVREGIPILLTSLTAYQVCCRAYNAGIV